MPVIGDTVSPEVVPDSEHVFRLEKLRSNPSLLDLRRLVLILSKVDLFVDRPLLDFNILNIFIDLFGCGTRRFIFGNGFVVTFEDLKFVAPLEKGRGISVHHQLFSFRQIRTNNRITFPCIKELFVLG